MLHSGASAHMVSDVTLVSNLQNISPIVIGSVAIRDEIKLDDVFYVPNLNCNLSSVSKLCKQLNCTMIYFDEFIVIQDRISRSLIGASEQRDRV